jgi:hypothetical protein
MASRGGWLTWYIIAKRKTAMKHYVVFFENDVRGDGVDCAGPFVVPLSDEEVAVLKSDTIFPYVGYAEAMDHYLETDPDYNLAVLFNELYNLRPCVDINKTGPVEIHGVISAWMSTDL